MFGARLFEDVFTGEDLVSWLINVGLVEDRSEGVEYGSKLVGIMFGQFFSPYLSICSIFFHILSFFVVFCIILSFEHDCELYLDDQTQDEKKAKIWLHVDNVVHGVYCLHLDLIGSKL